MVLESCAGFEAGTMATNLVAAVIPHDQGGLTTVVVAAARATAATASRRATRTATTRMRPSTTDARLPEAEAPQDGDDDGDRAN